MNEPKAASKIITESAAGSVSFAVPPIDSTHPTAEVNIRGFGGAWLPTVELNRMCIEWLAHSAPFTLSGVMVERGPAPADGSFRKLFRSLNDLAASLQEEARLGTHGLTEDEARNLLVLCAWVAGGAAGQLGLVLDDAGEPLC